MRLIDPILRDFKFYRRFRGGRWHRVGGYLWGKRWVKVPAQCLSETEEDYRSLTIWGERVLDRLWRRRSRLFWAAGFALGAVGLLDEEEGA